MKEPVIETYDLETLRLVYYSAVRLSYDVSGEPCGFSVIGQPSPWPKREASAQKLMKLGFIEVMPGCEGLLEAMVRLTPRGECVYGQFLDALEGGAFKGRS